MKQKPFDVKLFALIDRHFKPHLENQVRNKGRQGGYQNHHGPFLRFDRPKQKADKEGRGRNKSQRAQDQGVDHQATKAMSGLDH
jgi:hypothetical protein